MSGISKKLMGTTAAGGEALAIEDVFSTYLYTGDATTRTISNGIDLAGEGGLAWLKRRDSTGDHFLYDTERGATYFLETNTTDAEDRNTNTLQSFVSDGFTLGSGINTNGAGRTYTSWTFRKAPRFFDVVTYTGDGTGNKSVPHNLGVAPGFYTAKTTAIADNWFSYHRSLGATKYVSIDSSGAAQTNSNIWGDTEPTDTHFTIGTGLNVSGRTYVIYLFAHDPLGPSEDGSDGLIACGSYTGNGSADGPEIDLGWEPQWVLVKRATVSTGNWFLFDTMRGIPTGGNDVILYPNASNGEAASANVVDLLSRGFKIVDGSANTNASGSTYIYIAIRRGPMRAPTSGTEVFAPTLGTSGAPAFKTDWFPDFGIYKNANRTSVGNYIVGSRLQGINYLNTATTDAETSWANVLWDWKGWINDGGLNSNYISWMFRRAPGFFDVVAYSGDGVAGRTVPHNLGVAPELMIVKRRNITRPWAIYHHALGNEGVLRFDDGAVGTGNTTWNSTDPSADEFTCGSQNTVNGAGDTYVAYLFSTLNGISKVGSYTGNGSSQTINCEFTTGARFILIKRTDSTGDWYVWDTARGIVTGNDPHLSLNTTAAEVTTDDSIDPDSSGFIVNQVAATNINVSSASYIFYAVA